jgi:F0F1-type ATP synthase membrane subunit b/b'
MSSLVDTLEHAGLVLSGAVLCYLLVRWRKRETSRTESLEAKSLLEQARKEAEIIVRGARVTASEEALKQHEQTEQAGAARRAERLELEKRLAERECLINSQLQRIVDAEKNLSLEKESL